MADGQILSQRYQIDSVLGQGGMAEVYLGTDTVLGRRVAVKVLGSQFARDHSFVARFRREAQAAAALNHPNVVSVFDTGSDDGTHFIVMEYVQGKTLADAIHEDAPLLPERAVEITEAVAAALGFAHESGIIHRDVKPGNIMLTAGGDVKVMDFGIARATTSDSLTQTATVLGTATYFSPEQAQGQPVDARSDIYSLGCVLYEMLTGHTPFAGDSPVAVAYKHVKEDPRPPSRLNADVPPALDAIVLKCLAKNPNNRYQTAAELRHDLRRFGAGAPVAATPVMGPEPTALVPPVDHPTSVLPAETTQAVERPRRWIGAAILGVILAILAVGLFLLARSLLGSNAELVTVPDVIGMQRTAAERRLINEGFRIGDVTTRFDPKPPGEVLDYSPKRAELGSAIDLTVSRGPQVVKVTVPDVVCLSEEDATAELEAQGFLVDVVGEAENSQCPGGGAVGKQDPTGNTQAEKGFTVQLWLVPEPSPTPTSPSPSPTTPSPPPTTPSPTITISITPPATAIPARTPAG